MPKKNGLVSVIVPVFNGVNFIEHAISSVKKQTYKDWELIVVDDASVDGTANLVRGLQHFDERIKLVHLASNVGVASARNLGLAAARGRYVAFLDADDVWLETKLARQLELMYKKSSHLVYSGYQFANENAEPNGRVVRIPQEMSVKDLYGNHLIWTSTVVIDLNKVDRKDIQMLDIKYGEDITTWWRILSKYGPAQGLNLPLALYRRGGATLSSNKLLIIKKKWDVFGYSDLGFLRRVQYYILSLINAARKRV